MPKIITALQAPPGAGRAAFQAQALERLAPNGAALAGIHKLTLNLVQDAPSFITLPPPKPTSPPVYDAIMMAWLEEDAIGAYVAACSAAGGTVHHYLVSEILERDDLPIARGARTPGIKNISFIVAREQHGAASIREHWRVHGELGLRIHTGMRRYVRNLVGKALTPNAPLVHGIGEVCFPALEDLRLGLFPRPEDRQDFLDDIALWVEASTSHYAAEHVLKW